ncbi:MAG: TSUP family transporter [Gammaproteobacteria bacterium]
MLDTNIYLLLAVVGLIAGFVDGVAGGGALIMIPSLLSVGVPPHYVLGTNKLAAFMGLFNATYIYWRRNLLHPRYWLAAIMAVFIGAVFGTLATQLISSEALQKILPIIILAVAVYMLIPKSVHTYARNLNLKPNKISSSISGFILGFYDGFSGPGTGTFWVTIVMALYKVDILQASAIAKLMNLISNFVALMTFMLLSNVDYHLGLSIGIAMMVGSFIGVHSAIRHGAKFIRPIFISAVIVMAGHLIWTQWL